MSRSNATEIHAGRLYYEKLVGAYAFPCAPVAEILALDHDIIRLAEYIEKDPGNQYLGQAIYSQERIRAHLIKEYGA